MTVRGLQVFGQTLSPRLVSNIDLITGLYLHSEGDGLVEYGEVPVRGRQETIKLWALADEPGGGGAGGGRGGTVGRGAGPVPGRSVPRGPGIS